MKHIRLFESFSDIGSICDEYGITNYTINSDGSIDVDGDVNLTNKKLTKLPVKFNKVSGNFYCSSNKLTLEGGPKEVGGDFYCSNTQLTTLEGSPKEVGGDFNCFNNQLPKSIVNNIKYIKKILEYGEDYSIWRSDNTLDEYRFNDMMEEIKMEE